MIFNGISKAVKGFFDVRAPVLFVQLIFPFPEAVNIPQMGAGGRKNKGAAFIQVGEAGHIFPPKFIPQDFNRDNKLLGREAYLMVFCEAAAGNNAVHMHMVIQSLVPCMEDLDDPGRCPEPFLSADSSRTVSAQHL